MDDVGDEGGGEGDVLDPTMMEGSDGGGPGRSGLAGLAGLGSKMGTLQLETLSAMQQLGIVLAVGLLVGIIFFAMVTMETMMVRVSEFCQKKFCRKDQPDEEEDPAALVGTFKRYKNWAAHLTYNIVFSASPLYLECKEFQIDSQAPIGSPTQDWRQFQD